VPRVSVTIITLNESAHIAEAIDSAAWADETIVVDAGSTDDTVAIARARGVRVETREWTGWVDQKNYAAGLAANDWIFSLDADERLTPALADEIRTVLRTEPPRRGYRVPRVTYHLGRWMRTTDFYPDFQTRLYDRRAARWQGKYVHESVTVGGGAGQLRNELLHYSYRDLRDHLDRINSYTTLAARQMREAGRRSGPLDLLVHPPAAFLRNYLLRRGFLDGGAGLTLSLVNAYSVFLKFAKLWELQMREDSKSQSPKAQSPNLKSQNLSPEAEGSKAKSQEARQGNANPESHTPGVPR
jgi:glycosyltransferase involved in cell wall biosynthesis